MSVASAVPRSVPVTIHPDAAARIDELGLRPEFERMLEHTLETVTGLVSVEVRLEPPYEPGDEPGVTFDTLQSGVRAESDDTWERWSRWKLESFGPDVCRRFQLLPSHRD